MALPSSPSFCSAEQICNYARQPSIATQSLFVGELPRLAESYAESFAKVFAY